MNEKTAALLIEDKIRHLKGSLQEGPYSNLSIVCRIKHNTLSREFMRALRKAGVREAVDLDLLLTKEEAAGAVKTNLQDLEKISHALKSLQEKSLPRDQHGLTSLLTRFENYFKNIQKIQRYYELPGMVARMHNSLDVAA